MNSVNVDYKESIKHQSKLVWLQGTGCIDLAYILTLFINSTFIDGELI